jgi:hypothetical protein
MRVFGMLVAGLLALSTPVAASAVPLGSNMGAARTAPAPGIVKIWGGCAWGWRPVQSRTPRQALMGSVPILPVFAMRDAG